MKNIFKRFLCAAMVAVSCILSGTVANAAPIYIVSQLAQGTNTCALSVGTSVEIPVGDGTTISAKVAFIDGNMIEFTYDGETLPGTRGGTLNFTNADTGSVYFCRVRATSYVDVGHFMSIFGQDPFEIHFNPNWGVLMGDSVERRNAQ